MTHPPTAAWLEALGHRELRPGTWTLEVIDELCRRLGRPELAHPVVHVAGTRGKGSTCALVESSLRHAGLKTGLTTSPHLLSACERIRVNGLDISAERLLSLADRVRAAGAEDMQAGYFEVMTATAFLAFAEDPLDVIIVECGLGGRVDATNIVRPLVAGITRLGMDHADRLGGTRASIAREKAGILKPGVRGVLAPCPVEAADVVKARALELGVPLRVVGPADEERAPATALPGAAQRENAATALAILEELAVASEGRLSCDARAMADGFASARWRARLELIARGPKAPDLLLDVAHDVDGARALLDHLADGLASRAVRAVIFACLADKDLDGIARELAASARVSSAAVFVPALAGARARDPEAIARVLRAAGLRAESCPDTREALRRADAEAAAHPRPDAALVVAFGSFHVASAILPVVS